MKRPMYYILDDQLVAHPVSREVHMRWCDGGKVPGHLLDKCDHYDISTAFLCIDQRLFGSGPPLLWETLVFGPLDGLWSDYKRHYSTHQEAVAGHAAVLAAIKQGKSPEDLEWSS